MVSTTKAAAIIANDLKELTADDQEYFGITEIGPLSIDLRLPLAMRTPSFSSLADTELKFEIEFPQDYPFSPPLSIRFISPITHERVNDDGYFLLEILDLKNWSPTISLGDLIEFIQFALA